ncbi:MAG TPA: ice-binding family protein [Sulfuricurvum sp.]|nr:ice-binding family protein [Sulfuricurvum sp.]
MSIFKQYFNPIALITAVVMNAFISGCSGGGSTVLTPPVGTTSTAITGYSIGGATGIIDETAKTIAVTVPFGTDKTALIATFTTTGSNVKVGTTVQTSAVTANDFTAPVAYIVTAGDGTTATYTVTVSMGSITDKAITAYSINGIAGTINEPAKTISVTVPFGTVKTNLVATFTTTGSNVKVGTTVQTSAVTANDFTASVAYIVTAGDATTATYTVSVAVAAANPTAPVLGEAGRYVILASQGITGGAGSTLINGDMAVMDQARASMTGFTPTNVPADGLFTQLTGDTWVGELSRSYGMDDVLPFKVPLAYAPPHAAYANTLALINQSRTDLGVAYNFLAADPNPGAATQVCPTELGTLTLTRGVYKTASNVLLTTGTLHLDAQGDANAVWIFSIDGTFTTGAPGGSIDFVGGVGSAKNVYWRVAGVTTIGANTTFYGNVFAHANVDVLAGANITGSLFSNTASVTLITDTITKAQ